MQVRPDGRFAAPEDPADIIDDVECFPPLLDPHAVVERPIKGMTKNMIQTSLTKGERWFARQKVAWLPNYNHHEKGRETFPLDSMPMGTVFGPILDIQHKQHRTCVLVPALEHKDLCAEIWVTVWRSKNQTRASCALIIYREALISTTTTTMRTLLQVSEQLKFCNRVSKTETSF